MTVVNGLRLAYRGFVTGLAAGYAWLAIAMVVGALMQDDPLATLRPVVALLAPARDDPATAFVVGFGVVQLVSAVTGMLFAYFFGRFFTVRFTLAAATPCFALLAWSLLATVLASNGADAVALAVAPLLATLVYGLMLGAGLPLRSDVARA